MKSVSFAPNLIRDKTKRMAQRTCPSAGERELPVKLVKYISNPASAGKDTAGIIGNAKNALQKIFILLRNRTGHDFSVYKKSTVCRRIERRMRINNLNRVTEYLRYLQIHPQEPDLLFRELLIGVTDFFRDPEAFEALLKKGLPLLLENRPRNSVIRAWVIGCSTGEEAYSLAMLLRVFLSKKKSGVHKFRIFATDIDKNSLAAARLGVYPSVISADLSEARLRKYFIIEDDKYRVRRELREMIHFAAQDIITDPPFTGLDVISCRNVLIYLNSEVQKKLFQLFHGALNPSGLLFLGNCESPGSSGSLFKPVDRRHKIFSRREATDSQGEPIGLPPFLPYRVKKENGTDIRAGLSLSYVSGVTEAEIDSQKRASA